MPRWALPVEDEPAEESSEEEEGEEEAAGQEQGSESDGDQPDGSHEAAGGEQAEPAPATTGGKKSYKLQKPSERGGAGLGKELGCHVCGRKGHNAGFVGVRAAWSDSRTRTAAWRSQAAAWRAGAVCGLPQQVCLLPRLLSGSSAVRWAALVSRLACKRLQPAHGLHAVQAVLPVQGAGAHNGHLSAPLHGSRGGPLCSRRCRPAGGHAQPGDGRQARPDLLRACTDAWRARAAGAALCLPRSAAVPTAGAAVAGMRSRETGGRQIPLHAL